MPAKLLVVISKTTTERSNIHATSIIQKIVGTYTNVNALLEHFRQSYS